MPSPAPGSVGDAEPDPAAAVYARAGRPRNLPAFGRCQNVSFVGLGRALVRGQGTSPSASRQALPSPEQAKYSVVTLSRPRRSSLWVWTSSRNTSLPATGQAKHANLCFWSVANRLPYRFFDLKGEAACAAAIVSPALTLVQPRCAARRSTSNVDSAR